MGGLKISATKDRHPPLTHAYAYRLDARDRSIVLSVDTTFSPKLIALAEGADVLVHELMRLDGLESCSRAIRSRGSCASI